MLFLKVLTCVGCGFELWRDVYFVNKVSICELRHSIPLTLIYLHMIDINRNYCFLLFYCVLEEHLLLIV